ncbi:hypothetical protein KGM_206134 [Danaus plexippus plexippus]|uniref:Uncharacterized protein n=1 Tax=Danaus plexippus plexippus TaxID=278856 RepID=A0A212EGJ9_DANPL|nr:hypothetical protein KGM_206134 [Danaus plexippus plexippus]
MPNDALLQGAFGFSIVLMIVYIIMGIPLLYVESIVVVRLVIAAIKRRFREFIALDKTWGPKDEILQRSRGMFSAQAMTKEYIYRQYHLQAGILHRQRRSNIRSPLR